MEVPGELAALAGTWEGSYRVWLEPEVLACESPTRARVDVSPAAGALVYRYDWSYEGTAHEGVALFVRSGTRGWEMAWTDSWHNREALMSCVGHGPEPSVTGTYAETEDGPWRWRTDLHVDGDTFVVTAYNIDPAGNTARATQAVYTRTG